MIRNIIFDVDGTLWDASHEVTDSWNEALDRKYAGYGKHFTYAEMMQAMGHTMSEIAQMAFPQLPKSQRETMMQYCETYENEYLITHPGTFYPHLADTLQALKEKGFHFFIVSNCQDGYIQAMLASNTSLNALIDDFECYGRTEKPKSGSILLLMERNHISKEDSVYVGDTEMDEKAAEEAGIRFIHAAYGYGEAKHPDAEIKSLKDLPDALGRMTL